MTASAVMDLLDEPGLAPGERRAAGGATTPLQPSRAQ